MCNSGNFDKCHLVTTSVRHRTVPSSQKNPPCSLTPTSQHLTQPCRHPRAPSSSAGPTSARPPPGAVLPSLCSLRRRTKGPLVLAQALGWVGISQHPALLEVLDAGLCLSCLVPQAALPPRAPSRRESAEERGYAERIWQEQH